MPVIKNLIGIDIGHSCVKLVKLKKTRNAIVLDKAKAVEIGGSSSVTEAITALLKGEKIGSAKVAVSVSGQSVFTRFVKLPKISKKKVEQVVKYEAQQQIPFPIEKVVWDYQLFEHPKTPELEVFLSAVKKDIIDRLHTEVSQVKGVEVVSIQAAPIALYNLLKFNGQLHNGTIILDLGAKVTNVIISKDKQIWIRSIPIGGEDITASLARKLKITPKQAEALKKKEGITLAASSGQEELTPRSDAISKCIDPVLTDLLGEISRSISYYKSQFDKDAAFGRVLLTGGTSKIKYIDKFFEANLKLKTQRANLYAKITPNKFLKTNLDEIDECLGVALGLGLSAVVKPAIDLSLMPHEIKKLKEFNRKKVFILSSELVAIFIFMMLWLFATNAIRQDKDSLSAIEAEMQKYRSNMSDVNRLQQDITGIKKKLDFLGNVVDDRTYWLDILAQINSRIPEEAWLTRLSSGKEEDNTLIIEGKTTGSFDTIKNLRENFTGLEYFETVETLRADKPDPAEEENIEEYNLIFTLKATLRQPEPAVSAEQVALEDEKEKQR